MSNDAKFPLGVPYNITLEVHDEGRTNTFSADGMTLRNVRVVDDGSGHPRYELLFSRVAWKPTPVKPKPLDCMVKTSEQLFGSTGIVFNAFNQWPDMPVRRLARKLAKLTKPTPQTCNFQATDGRHYGVLTIAKVSEEKEIRAMFTPSRGLTAPDTTAKLETTKRFYFRDRWYANTGGEELSFRCSSYEALLGKDLSEMLEGRPYKAIVRMVLPKSEGSPLGAVLVEFIKNK